MKKNKIITNRSGLILIMALWSLSLLTVFAVTLGVQTRQRITLLSHLEQRSELPALAASGVRKAIALLNREILAAGVEFTLERKLFLKDNALSFGPQPMGNGTVSVSYASVNEAGTYYGLTDEESKININKADKFTLQRLVHTVLNLEDESSRELAEAIFDWREHGKSEITGFSSDEYYQNLQDPYPTKDADFETPEELLLVKGMNNGFYEKLVSFITVYGPGQVNINTAPREVLIALGFDYGLADKILGARKGEDATEATADDVIFTTPFMLGPVLKSLYELTPEETAQINGLIARNVLTTISFFYQIKSTARLGEENGRKGVVVCIYDSAAGRIQYWREYI